MEAQSFLRQLQDMKRRMADFERCGRDFLQSLPNVPEEEPLESVEAEIQGTLGCLLGDDLEPARRKLDELEGYLAAYQAPAEPC